MDSEMRISFEIVKRLKIEYKWYFEQLIFSIFFILQEKTKKKSI